MLRIISALVFIFVSASHVTIAKADVSLSTKMQLQADMQRHIDDRMVNGSYPSIDLTTGQLQTFYPASGHPMILEMTDQPLFVLCSEFRDAAGNNHNVDFYLKADGAGYKVIRTEIGNRDPLKALMQKGLVAKVD